MLGTIWSLVTMETTKALGSLTCEMGVGSGPTVGRHRGNQLNASNTQGLTHVVSVIRTGALS